ncbi:restriction endonuclease subunit S [Acidaminococcus fermentans]|uniref:restriction endonuclease subunit S n=1 Tax=Acidaminococcus fermentans TaxID=905 RepID=UPI00242DC160|nr:restriction endonuclease subunit S [Acidaminococcus fermentans]MCI6285787.1 restriction endonuclease subunit S [Acidaminococcus fermentans]
MKKEMKKVPAVRFTGFTGDWEQRKLGDIYKDIGNAFVGTATPYYVDNGHFYLESNNVKDGQINYNSEVFINNEFYERQKSKWLHTGDIVMVQSGHVGHSAVIPEELNNLAAHALIMFRHPKVEINPYFLNYQYQTCGAKKKIENITKGNTIKHILASDMQKFEVLIPSIDEQKKIGAFLQSIDSLFILHQRKYEMLKKIKKSFLEKMFPKNGKRVPELRFSGFTDDWEQHKLGEIGSTFTGLSGKTKEDFGHGDARFVTYMNVYSNSIADLAMTERVEIDQTQNSVKYGDIFFTTSSETPNEVGMSSVWLGNTENTYLNSFCFGYRPEVKVNPYYMAYMLRSPNVRNKLIILAQGISRYNISKNRVMDIEVPTPDLSEQKEIGQYFFNLDHLITLHQRKLEALQTLKKFLLQNLFV